MAILVDFRQALAEAEQEKPTRPDPNDTWAVRYVRAFLLLRVIIGVLGLALPTLVLLGCGLLSDEWSPRGSLSAYYYSGMREFFTGALWATGFFLVAYKVFEKTVENRATLIAGVACVGVATLPTARPDHSMLATTPLQDKVGEFFVRGCHYACALTFIAALAYLSHLFAAREGNRTEALGSRSPVFWKRFHNTCSGVIVGALVFVGLNKKPGLPLGHWVDGHYLWLGEVVAVLAFGTSWLFKGTELRQVPKP